jgi:hypothetical protein
MKRYLFDFFAILCAYLLALPHGMGVAMAASAFIGLYGCWCFSDGIACVTEVSRHG